MDNGPPGRGRGSTNSAKDNIMMKLDLTERLLGVNIPVHKTSATV